MIYISILIILLFVLLSVLTYNYLSGKNLIKDLIHFIKLNSRSLKQWDQFHSDISKSSDIVISFTTIPERIDKLDLTLKSLLYQNIQPASINIYIPYQSFRNNKPYRIPPILNELKNIQIHRVDVDYGPATKFIHALNSFPEEQQVLVVDDDNIYPPNYVEQFEEASRRYPDKILSASGWRVPDDLIDKPTTLKSNVFKLPPTPIPGTRIKKNYPVDIIQGYSGYLLKPVFFNLEELQDYSLTPEALRFVDDVWISAHAKVPKIVFPMKRFCYTPFLKKHDFSSSSLAKINNWNKPSNEDRNNTIGIKLFEERWLNFQNKKAD
ncbi:hypothetical protein [Gracilimonas sp.]|uniref:hypothetical protein n=1 Tax=Gracilimonas sp. TaxID=1974203 RepID=UPI003BA9F291